MSARLTLARRHALAPLGALVLALLSPKADAASMIVCSNGCVRADTIENGAGVDPKLFAAIGFRGNAIDASASNKALHAIAQGWRAGGRHRLELQVAAQGDGAAAHRQAERRAASLRRSLVGAGVAQQSLSVTATP